MKAPDRDTLSPRERAATSEGFSAFCLLLSAFCFLLSASDQHEVRMINAPLNMSGNGNEASLRIQDFQ
jgi:hypothetical protein